MSQFRSAVRVAVTSLAIMAMAACATTDVSSGVTSTMKVYDAGKWLYWGGDAGQTRYAPLDQINLSNVSRLKIAWRWTADATGGSCCGDFKATPLMDDGVLYLPWLNHGMAAIDAGTGKTIWTYEPQPASAGTLAPRSLAYWTDGKIKRLFHNSFDGRLIAVDAKTGQPAREFGNNGQIDLKGTLAPDRTANRGESRSVSPALVVGDIIIVQTIPNGARNKEVLPGDIRGYDVRTGKLIWTFHVVPRKGEFGYDTWGNGSAEFAGQGGVWSMMSADPELGYVYLPTEDPSNDFAGVERPGDNLFSNSIVCLDAKTGKRVWHFQIIHHGTWDLDNPAAPILHDVIKDGKRIKAVTQLTKQGLVFTFDRKTGKPVWPIEERPVPQDAVPGEKTSPTQPFPTRPGPLSHMGYDESWLMDFTPELRKQAVEIMKQYKTGPYYTQEVDINATGLKGTLIYPGYGGGPNWSGAAVDPETGMMYVPIRHKPNSGALAKGNPANTNMAYVQTGGGVATIMGPGGLPILKPPYSEVVAVDMNKGEQNWRIPIGGAGPAIRNNPLLKGLNLDFDHMGQWDAKPSPLLTKELMFLGEAGNLGGGSGGPMFRAYDKRDGKVVKEIELPTLVTAAPMTYVYKGRQYVVVAVSNRGKPAEVVALTLDGASENGPAPAGGVKAWPAPLSHAAAVAQISATPAELDRGKTAFAANCASCHGDTGKGGAGPNITGRNDFDNVRGAIISGRGEMPALGASLPQADIDAIAKYVVKTLNPPAPAVAGRAGRGGSAPGEN